MINLRRAGLILRCCPATLKHACCSVQQLLLPGVDLVRVNPVRACQLGNRSIALDRRQRHLRLECRPVLLACLLHVPLPRQPALLGAGLHLNQLSHFRGPAHTSLVSVTPSFSPADLQSCSRSCDLSSSFSWLQGSSGLLSSLASGGLSDLLPLSSSFFAAFSEGLPSASPFSLPASSPVCLHPYPRLRHIYRHPCRPACPTLGPTCCRCPAAPCHSCRSP